MRVFVQAASLKLLSTGCLIAALVLACSANAWAEASGGPEGDFYDHGVGAGTWIVDPDTGAWVDKPVGIADNPVGYRFQIVCLRGGDLSIACQRVNQVCTRADGGQLVRWFSGLKVAPSATWTEIGESCIYAEKPQDVMDEIAGMIEKEFQSRPVKAGELTLQPSPHTLIRANTNFYVESQEQKFDLDLLGQDVKIVATPTEYTWNYGDGTTYGPTSSAGYALHATNLGEETSTSHPYQETGDYPVSVTVHFRGKYAVNGGAMIPIDGRGKFTTGEQTISVWKSESRLVEGTCLDNPNAWGC